MTDAETAAELADAIEHGRVTFVREGDLYDSEDPIVQAFPELFGPLVEPDSEAT